MRAFRYESIFMYASLQFCGNIEEYFAKHTRKLIVFIVLPRIGNKTNIIRQYFEGKLIDEKKVKSSENVFLYYLFWFVYHWYILINYFSLKEHFFIISGHPVTFIGLTVQRIIRKITVVYWIGDYFPGDGLIIKSYENLKKYYHMRADFTLYLSDRINKIFNSGRVLSSNRSHTVMWGVKPPLRKRNLLKNKFTIFFVGIIREQQGIDLIFDSIKEDPSMHLYIIGACEKNLFKKYLKLIKDAGISRQIFFPNKNYYGKKLREFAQKSDIGIAFYDKGKQNVTYYADPAKVKTYTQFGLPVIMTDASPIAAYVKKYKAGLVVNNDNKSINQAIREVKKNYKEYYEGVKMFNAYFDYEKYYNEKFSFLKSV